MVRIILSLFILSISFSSNAQNSPAYKAAVKAEAIKMGRSLVAKDYEKFIETTYPKAFEYTEGGKAALLKELKDQMNEMAENGSYIICTTPGEVSAIIDTAGELQCTIPQLTEIKLPDGSVTSETTLIAISGNKGKTWHFIDAAGKNISELHDLFPSLSMQLVIPESKEPVFLEDKH